MTDLLISSTFLSYIYIFSILINRFLGFVSLALRLRLIDRAQFWELDGWVGIHYILKVREETTEAHIHTLHIVGHVHVLRATLRQLFDIVAGEGVIAQVDDTSKPI